jgi:DNA mismatch repair ATPase MutS
MTGSEEDDNVDYWLADEAEQSDAGTEQSVRTTTFSATTLSKVTAGSGWMGCLVESRGACTQIGLAALNTRSMQCRVLQFADTLQCQDTLSQLAIFRPELLILCQSATETIHPTRLYDAIRREHPNLMVTLVARGLVDSVAGMQRLCQSCLPRQLAAIAVALENKAYALAAANALLQSMSTEVDIQPGTLNVSINSLDGNMQPFMDYCTIRHLDLLPSSKSGTSLYGLLDSCDTPMGRRELQKRILQPLTKAADIGCVQEAIRYLQWHPQTPLLKDKLRNMGNLDKVISGVVCRRRKDERLDHLDIRITRVFVLRTTIVSIGNVVELLANMEGLPGYLRNVLSGLTESDFARDFVVQTDRILNPDITVDLDKRRGNSLMQHRKCYAILPGIDFLLDAARQAFRELAADVGEYIDALGQSTSMALVPKWLRGKGFACKLLEPTTSPPSRFIPMSGLDIYSTLDLVSFDDLLGSVDQDEHALDGQSAGRVCPQ